MAPSRSSSASASSPRVVGAWPGTGGSTAGSPVLEAHRERGRAAHEGRRQDDRQDGRREDQVVAAGVDQLHVQRLLREEEAELADLGDRRSEQDRAAQRQAAAPAPGRRSQSLDDHRDHQQGQQRRPVAHQGGRVQQHPDRHEEQDREQVAERDDLAGRLVRQVRLGDDDPGHERAEREREPEHRAREERGQQRRREHREQEQLRRPEAADGPEEPRQDARPHDVGEREEQAPSAAARTGTGATEPSPASGSSSAISRIVTRSWTTIQPIAARPWRLSISPRSTRILSTTSVELMAMADPMTTAASGLQAERDRDRRARRRP